jgi:hypothetical protein
MSGALSAIVMLTLALASAVPPDVRNARDLFFDRRYSEARQAWEDVRRSGQGEDAQVALYWIARCSQSLGELDRAMDEYDRFLASGSRDPAIVEEARTHRVSLAIVLVRRGNKERLDIVKDALRSESRNVRYFAALESAGLGVGVDRAAAGVLKEILAKERDADLVDRAKLRLLQIDPHALQPATPSRERPPAHEVRWVKVRVYDAGKREASVSVNIPVALAELLFKSLPDDVRKELGRRGYEDANFWQRLRQTGPAQIIDIQNSDGTRIQVWTE